MLELSPSNSAPFVVGLTGGIGCGKTTVLEVFHSLGVPCFVSDRRAAAYYGDPDFLRQIRSLFGSEVFTPDGAPDKRAIASIVFKDKQMLLKLNAIVHPRVIREFEQWRHLQTSRYVVFESAILYEYGLERMANKVVCVYLEKEERLRRLALRDKVSREAIEMRMSSQISAEEKMNRADYVVLNYEGNPRLRQVQYIHQSLMRVFQ